MGASGNSGAILSQIVGGFVDVVGRAPSSTPHTLARALRSASDAAYRPVQLPIEGTMLTVIREMAEAAETRAGADLDAVIDEVLDAAAESVVRTQSMLAVLREAGVVDAGAAGLVEFCRGAVAGRARRAHPGAARGDRPAAQPRGGAPGGVPVPVLHLVPARGRRRSTATGSRAQLVAMGDCLLVVGEAPMCRVHLHTDDPGAALTRAVAMGSIDRVSIANMQEQTRQREERLRSAPKLVALPGGRPADARLTAENTAIVLDSTADLPHPEREHPNWRMVPLTVRFGDGAVRGLGRHRAGRVLPAAAKRRPAPADGGAVARGLPAHVRAAGRLRPCDRAAGVLARVGQRPGGADRRRRPAAGGRVTVLDGHTVSVGTGCWPTACSACSRRARPSTRSTAWVEDARERLHLVIYVDTLEYLRRGGRISRTRELAGNAVGLRPLLTLRDGEVALYRRVVGGRRRALREFDRFLCANAPADADVRVALAHAADPTASSASPPPCAGCGRGPGSSGCASSAPSWGRTEGRARSGCWCWRSVDQGIRGLRSRPPTASRGRARPPSRRTSGSRRRPGGRSRRRLGCCGRGRS